MRTPFKMKGFSGFGNSPLKQDLPTTPANTTQTLENEELQEAPGLRTTESMGIDTRDTTTTNSMRQSISEKRASGGILDSELPR